MQPAGSKPKKGGLMLPSAEVMAKLERSLVQNSPPNFSSAAEKAEQTEKEVPSPVIEATQQVDKVNPEQSGLTRVNATQPKGKRAPAEELPHPTHGQRVRLSLYVTPEEAAAIKRISLECKRSESYIGGELLSEAIKARSKR